jgi:hypothetical protein
LQSEEERYFEKHTLQLAVNSNQFFQLSENSNQLDDKKLITVYCIYALMVFKTNLVAQKTANLW